MTRYQQLDLTATCYCACCGEAMSIEVDPSAGSWQQYVEDCQVCCRPNILTVQFNAEGIAEIDTTPESQ